VTLTIDL